MPRYIAFKEGEDPDELDELLLLKWDPMDTMLYIPKSNRWMMYIWVHQRHEYRWVDIPENQIPKEYRTYLLLNPVRN